MFEYYYSKPIHHITEKSVVIALSTYAFSLAFSTKFRVISLINIVIAFVAGGLYGSVEDQLNFDPWSVPAVTIYVLVIFAIAERYHRHINENEICWFYSVFNS
ncbi:hypothetical protein HDF19_09915 [Mucilaginibacter sp. E4BP6]|uniref:hypothetical protein n=1 Tax=Mucilaginibacter sp. E4BP6 TaxID=2723089 RepID=UPI0015CEEC41|nr:hypothetical protein [Mucilaginibacter sp. E4BP6]NYE67789.1 undecaprenyl pyrophosphate phosphatase UppP [Mucilaginibacter sp. E4BP6]